MSWAWQFFAFELRRVLAYRADFWMHLVGSVATYTVFSYFLWKGVYEHTGRARIGGLDFESMVYYFLLVGLVDRIARGVDFGVISDEIYTGSINRYLVYPVAYLATKFASQLAHAVVGVIQFVAMASAYAWAIGAPEGVTPLTLGAGAMTAVFSGLLFLSITACLELVAFWAENVWSLQVLLRLTSSLLGGGFVPIALFPGWARSAVEASPFPWLTSFPVLTALGQVGLADWSLGFARLLGWLAFFVGVSVIVWRKGIRGYVGVGM